MDISPAWKRHHRRFCFVYSAFPTNRYLLIKAPGSVINSEFLSESEFSHLYVPTSFWRFVRESSSSCFFWFHKNTVWVTGPTFLCKLMLTVSVLTNQALLPGSLRWSFKAAFVSFSVAAPLACFDHQLLWSLIKSQSFLTFSTYSYFNSADLHLDCPPPIQKNPSE